MRAEEVMLFILLVIPVASFCLGMTLRFAIQPMVETIAQALRDSKTLPPATVVDSTALLEVREQMHVLTEAVTDLTTEVEFDQQLIGAKRTE